LRNAVTLCMGTIARFSQFVAGARHGRTNGRGLRVTGFRRRLLSGNAVSRPSAIMRGQNIGKYLATRADLSQSTGWSPLVVDYGLKGCYRPESSGQPKTALTSVNPR